MSEQDLNRIEAREAMGELIDVLVRKGEELDMARPQQNADTHADDAGSDVFVCNDAAETAVDEVEIVSEAGSAPKRRRRKRRLFSLQGVCQCFMVAVLAMLLVAQGVFHIFTEYPYAVKTDDGIICYVVDRDAANDAVWKAIRKMAGKNADMKLFTAGGPIRVERSETRDVSRKDILRADRAADKIVETFSAEDGDKDGIMVLSVQTETRRFTPDPVYKQDETQLAGTTYVENEGRDGRKEVTMYVETTNGKVTKKTDLSVNVKDEGDPKVIVKGVLGMPEDADWKTYEGDPVYSNGDDLAVTAAGYAGKLKYVLGGHNLATGVDCVGFVREMYRLYGINLSSHLKQEGIAVSYKNAQPGDILCFTHHFGIYLGDGKMVHAANPKADVVITGIGAGGKLVGVRRIVGRG